MKQAFTDLGPTKRPMGNSNKEFPALLFLLLSITGSSCKEEDTAAVITPPITGVDMLLIGNSFFKPYANKLADQATDAGLTDHHGFVITRAEKMAVPSTSGTIQAAQNICR